jgi:beta-lactamase superfamily II metal-dependent hydrolase
MATERDEPDTTKPNGTSIAFALAHDNRRVLFGADAHPDDLAQALRRLEPEAERIHFDAVKVIHHGSAANNTSQLTGLLESPLWLISTDGSRHRHPDPEAIARIVLTKSAGKKLLFNYATRYNRVWENAELQVHFDYRVEYGPQGQPSAINLTA